MRLAILDLGTNTFNLLVIEFTNSANYKVLYDKSIPSKLGTGCINENILSPQAFQRGLNAADEHIATAKSFNPNKIYAFATSAIRSASNGKQFVEAIQNKHNISVEIISGQKEAEFIYYGARQAIKLSNNYVLILDIGGGSCEFIIANKYTIFWEHSFNIGITRIIEKFKPSDPITHNEIIIIENYIDAMLLPLYEAIKLYPCKTLIGTSGSFETIAKLIANQFFTPSILNNTTNFIIDIDKFKVIHKQLVKLTLSERKQMNGMDMIRVEMMTVSSIFIDFILRKLSIIQFIQTPFALKEGVIPTLIKQTV